MAWPSLAEYNAALSRAPASLHPASLDGFGVVNGPLGLPMPVSGGYAYIYELRSGTGARKALRCFREDDPKRRRQASESCRFLAAALAAEQTLRPNFIRAEWEESCLETKSGIVPAMIMDWAEARTLGAHLEAVQDNPAAFLSTRENLAALARRLDEARIVHGDLQTGNILIRSDGTPLLIDYDGMRFTSSSPGPSAPDAHPHFQHPEWDGSCDPRLKDRFPAIAIDLGLAAAAASPKLFARFSTGENVLFRAEDYAEPASSPVFAAVGAIPALTHAAELFAGLALASPSALPTLVEFRDEAYRVVARTTGADFGTAVADRTATPAAYQSPYSVFSALDYHGIEKAVGEKVEVVGRVVSVRCAVTKYGKPYAFMNFGDWRRNCFKLTVWSEGLKTFKECPDDSWASRWISAIGLVDEPYTNARFGTTQLSITVQDASQIRFIDEAEASRRLGKPNAQTATVKPSTATKPSAPRNKKSASKPSNAELIQALSTPSRPKSAAGPVSSPPVPRQSPFQAPSGYSAPPPEPSKGKGCLIAVIIIVLLLWIGSL